MAFDDRNYQRNENESDGNRPNYTGFGGSNWRLWSMTLWIIIATSLGTLYQMATMGARSVTTADMTNQLLYDSGQVANWQVWRLFTYPLFGFHIISVLFTMIALYVAGSLLEPLWGRTRTLIVYLLLSACGAGIATAYAALIGPRATVSLDTLTSMSLGARYVMLAGPEVPVLALFMTAAARFPNHPMRLLFIPIDFPLKVFGWVMAGFMLLAVLLGSASSLMAAGCLGAALIGLLLIKFPKLLGFADSLHSGLDYLKSLKSRYREHQRIKALKAHADLQIEVDRILDKVRQHRLDSLTEAEKRTLKRATELQNQKPTRL